MNKLNSGLVQTERWLYTWNPRDQLTQVEKRTGTGSGTYAGKVEYAYCLSCDGALARRKQYDTVTSTKLTSDKRYEYDGLKLLRVDERCDADGDGEVEAGETTWRTVEASTYGPGIVGNLLAKRVYSYPGGGDRCTSNGSTDYYYAYDHVGNVYMIFDSAGNEVYHFNQDAFGNELNFEGYTGDSWATAAAAGLAEHQTGKWIDSFSGLYFFHARWYEPGLGRFVSRDPLSTSGRGGYTLTENLPVMRVDATGLYSVGSMEILLQLSKGVICAKNIESQVVGRLNDKHKHCLAACRITKECPYGPTLGPLLAILDEIRDALHPGHHEGFGWIDLLAGLNGVVVAGFCDDCKKGCEAIIPADTPVEDIESPAY